MPWGPSCVELTFHAESLPERSAANLFLQAIDPVESELMIGWCSMTHKPLAYLLSLGTTAQCELIEGTAEKKRQHKINIFYLVNYFKSNLFTIVTKIKSQTRITYPILSSVLEAQMKNISQCHLSIIVWYLRYKFVKCIHHCKNITGKYKVTIHDNYK